MASTTRGFGKTLLISAIVFIAAVAALYGFAHHTVVQKADASYSDFAPVSARLSRFKVTGAHTFSIFWKLRFAKESRRTPSVAVWHARPFGAVDFEGAKR
jgi:hypothetical protein